MKTDKRKQGFHVPANVRTRGLQMLRDGKTGPEVERELHVSGTTVTRWRALLKAKPEANGKPVVAAAVPSYLAKQLEIISRMIREKLPELAKFTLTAGIDGKAEVEYAVRRTTLVSGTVKL